MLQEAATEICNPFEQRVRAEKENALRQGLSLAQIDEMDISEQGNERRAILEAVKAEIMKLYSVPNSESISNSESTDEGPRLQFYEVQYNRWTPRTRARCSWEEVRARLLAQNGRYLALAEGMNEKGVLFGLDEEGNLLIADGGDPIMIGMKYVDARNRVLYEFDRDEMKKEGGKPVKTGYEMFPATKNTEPTYRNLQHKLSPEVKMFLKFTSKPFAKCPKATRWSSVWLESGDTETSALSVQYNQDSDHHIVRPGGFGGDIGGVRRLLRVPKPL